MAFTGRPKRSLGQNFLTDPNTARKIVEALHIRPGDAVVEIGPGRGALTGFLMESGAGEVVAIEKDRELALELARRFPGLRVVNADAMAFAWERLCGLKSTVAGERGLRVVGNLPYNVASPIMWDLASRCACFDRAVFMVQLEVAERIVARPRCKAYGGLSVWLQNFVVPEKLFKVGPAVFFPRPKVDSAVVAFTAKPLGERPEDPRKLAALVKRLFSMRRKQLGRILGADLSGPVGRYIITEKIDSNCRPEELSPGQLLDISRFF